MSQKKKQGKGMGKNFESIADQSNRYADEQAQSIKYPGAYKENIKVLALMRDGIEWRVSEIYSVREAKLFNEEDIADSDNTGHILYDDKKVQEHPKTKTAEENKQTYLERFLSERKRIIEEQKM